MDAPSPIQQSRVAFVTGFFNKLDHYKRLLFRYWWIPALTVFIGVVVQLQLLKKLPTTYISEGEMIVNSKVTVPNANLIQEADPGNFLGTQIQLMQSEMVANRAKAHLAETHSNVPPAPVEISVSLKPKSSIFLLTASGRSAEYTPLYLEEIMQQYMALKHEMLTNVSESTELGMKERLKEYGEELQKSKDAVVSYTASNPIIQLQHGDAAAEELQDISKKLDDTKVELETQKGYTLDQSLEVREHASAALSNPDSPTAISTNTPASTNTAARSLISNLGVAGQNYLDTKREIQRTQAELIKLTNSAPKNERIPVLIDKLAQLKNDLQTFEEQSRQEYTNHLHELEVSIGVLQKQVDAKKDYVLDLNSKRAALEALKENQKRAQAHYDGLQESLERLQFDKDLHQESVTPFVHASAVIALPPDRTKRLTMASLLGLVIGIGIVVFIDRLDDRPTAVSDMEKLFDLPVLGQIPRMKVASKKRGIPLLQNDDDRYPLIEACNSLRSALFYGDALHEMAKESLKSIVITSARPQDGKSMVTANFAITLAQTGARVLLIDADVRRGVLHKQFSVESVPGLVDVLSGTATLARATLTTHIPTLHLLPCGSQVRNPGTLFATAGSFIADIESKYDYCVFDTAPVLVGDDVLSLAPQADGLLMVVRARFTSARIAHAALDLLHARGVNVLGLIFNAVNPKASDFYQYRYKQYYPRPTAK